MWGTSTALCNLAAATSLVAGFIGSAATAHPLGRCLPPIELDDRDGDAGRNITALSAPALCIGTDTFTENRLAWHLVVIQNRDDPSRVLWFVPHNNEHAAFDTAVDSVTRFGGTVIAVKTGGTRFNGPQDPNRNFDIGTSQRCPEQKAPSPIYTDHVVRWHGPGEPIVALHTNEPGYAGDQRGARGTISIAHPAPNVTPMRATSTPLGKSPDDTMIFVAATMLPDANAPLMRRANRLRSEGVNIAYETVRPEINDCSLSNYAALKGIADYFNIEVVDGDGATQRQLVGLLMNLLAINAQ